MSLLKFLKPNISNVDATVIKRKTIAMSDEENSSDDEDSRIDYEELDKADAYHQNLQKRTETIFNNAFNYQQRKAVDNDSDDDDGESCEDGPMKPDPKLDNYEKDGFLASDNDDSIEYETGADSEDDYRDEDGQLQYHLVPDKAFQRYQKTINLRDDAPLATINVDEEMDIFENDDSQNTPVIPNGNKAPSSMKRKRALNPQLQFEKDRQAKLLKNQVDPRKHLYCNEMRFLGDETILKIRRPELTKEERANIILGDLLLSAYPIRGDPSNCMTVDELPENYVNEVLAFPTILNAKINFSL